MGPLIICKAVKVTFTVYWSQGGCLRVQRGSRGGLGVLWGQEGYLGDPMGPLGWFDESSDDS